MTAQLLNHDSKIYVCVCVKGLERSSVGKDERGRRAEEKERKVEEDLTEKHLSCSLQHKDKKTTMASRCCFDAFCECLCKNTNSTSLELRQTC